MNEGPTLLVMYYNPEENEKGRGFMTRINSELEGVLWPI